MNTNSDVTSIDLRLSSFRQYPKNAVFVTCNMSCNSVFAKIIIIIIKILIECNDNNIINNYKG